MWAKILFLVTVLACGVWKCRYGIEIYDEPFYLAPGFKLLALGDLPFQTEVLNGPRLHDLFNHYLIRPLLPFDVLTLRIAALGTFAACLALLAGAATRAFTLPLCFIAACFTLFDGLSPHSWSYTHWARNGLLLHAALLLFSTRAPSQWRRPLCFAAGFIAGVTVLCYNPLIAACLLAGACLYWGGLPWAPYFGGLCAAVGAGAAYILSPANFDPWRHSFQAAAQFAEKTTRVFSPEKLQLLLGYVVTRPELWLFTALFVGVQRRHPRICALAVVGILSRAIFCTLKSDAHATAWVLGALISLGLSAALWLLVSAYQKRDGVLAAITLSAVAGAFTMGLSSWSANGALFWLLVIPAVILIARLPPSRWSTVAFGLVLAFTTRYTLTHTYGDVSPGESTARLTAPPLTGVHTSPGRAHLLEQLAHHLEGQKFVLAYPSLPVAFLFAQTRSSVDSLWVSVHAPLELRRRSLSFMRDAHRKPTRLIQLKTNGWSWGKAPVLLQRPSDGMYDELYGCASGDRLFDSTEIEIVSVSPKFEECLQQVLTAKEPTHS